jgi:hypothetical protein
METACAIEHTALETTHGSAARHHARLEPGFLASRYLHCGVMNMEVFLLLCWDELDDWVGACKHLLRLT